MYVSVGLFRCGLFGVDSGRWVCIEHVCLIVFVYFMYISVRPVDDG